MSRRGDHARQARTTLGWGALVFVTGLCASAVDLDGWHPEVYDVEYASRLATLRARQAEAPGRPLLLAVGSSRTVMSFTPELLPPLRTAGGADCLPFNFGHIGAGPIMNLMQLRRMLADGVRPDWLLLEVMPSYLSHEGWYFITLHTAARDFPVLYRHVPWYHLYGDYLLHRLRTGVKYPGEVARRFAPDWAPAPLVRETDLLPLGGCTFVKDDVSAADRARFTEIARGHLESRLRDFKVSPRADRAMRELLSLCRRERIRTVLVLTPEGSVVNGWYAPGAPAQVDGYCAALGREFDAPVLDARGWLADSDFYDYHHVLRRGAEAYTRRLGHDVLQPLVAAGDYSWAARLEPPERH
jgi:hypothetical protein